MLASATQGLQLTSSSLIVTVAVEGLPMVAPPVGAERVAVKVSFDSSFESPTIGTWSVLLLLSPLPHERTAFETA